MKKLIYIFFVSVLIFNSCKSGKKNEPGNAGLVDLKQIIATDTLRVGMLNGATSYFLYRDEYLGYDLELAQSIAEDLKVNLKVVEAKSQTEMEEMLQNGKIDIAGYDIFETTGLKQNFNFVLPQTNTYQVIVQRIGTNLASDVIELEGKKIYAQPNTILYRRLKTLNSELGNIFEIVDAADSLDNEDLIEMVGEGKIDFTVAYYNTAFLYKSYYKKLDCNLQIGFNQRNGWMVRKESAELKQYLDKWSAITENQEKMEVLHEKYWLRSPYFAIRKVKIPKGAISPYDHLFKKYAKEINWEWQLLAAVAFHESKFDSTQVSWAGAAGIMQLMPRTAANFGLSRKSVFNPEKNIEAGVQYIKSLNMSFRKIQNKEERIKFILAAYNSGPAHIFDAMALAEKYGKNPQVWFDNVEYYLKKKSEPEFYNDPVVKRGRFRGKETIAYVVNTLDTYHNYRLRAK